MVVVNKEGRPISDNSRNFAIKVYTVLLNNTCLVCLHVNLQQNLKSKNYYQKIKINELNLDFCTMRGKNNFYTLVQYGEKIISTH